MDAPPAGLAMAGLATVRAVAVTAAGDTGLGEALVEQLGARGFAARLVDEAGLAALIDELPDTPLAVIYGGGLADVDLAGAQAINREAFAIARRFAGHASAHGGIFVTLQDTGGDFGLAGVDRARAVLGGLAGLAKTAALEWPRASVRAIDIQRGGRDASALAHAITEEILAGGGGIEVGLSASGLRCRLESVARPATPVVPAPLSPASVVVCSGGARGVTASTMVALARTHQPAIALLGRTPLRDEPSACAGIEGDAALKRTLLDAAKREGKKVTPAELGAQARSILAVREIRATLEALESAGSRARYFCVDVSDAAGVTATLAEVRAAWGPITGLVHGAGVVADKLIADKTDEQFARVFDTKVHGLLALLEATADDPIDTLVMFSSVAARSGNLGQCDYAMANEILNKVAASERRRRGGALVVKSLGWGPWEAGMVTPSLKSYFEAHGVALIGLEAGANMLLDELRADPEAVEVVLGAPPQRAAIAGDAPREERFDVLVHASRQPYLHDHAIDGTPVLPMAMVVELLARAALAMRPGKVVTACRQLKMYRGVVLDRFSSSGHWLLVRGHESSDGSLALTLSDAQAPERKHYAALVDLANATADAPPFEPPRLELEALPVPIYGGALFHGSEFQVISKVQGVGRHGIVGDLVGVAERDWTGGPFQADPAAIDGGIQLAVLWAEQQLGGKGLPTGLGAYRSFTSTPATGPLRCTVAARPEGSHSAVSDITFVDRRGCVVLQLEGVETHQRP